MIYGIQLYNHEPRVKVDIDLSAAQYTALHDAEPGTLAGMEKTSLDALRGAGLTNADRAHLSLGATTVTKAAPGYTIEQAEELSRGESFESPTSPEAKIVVNAISPLIFRQQKQHFWQKIIDSGEPIL